jgi:tetratricopeptide (TPR) repeat protein
LLLLPTLISAEPTPSIVSDWEKVLDNISAELPRPKISQFKASDYLQRGIEEYQASSWEKALDNFLLAKNAGVRNPDLFYNIGNAYFMSGDIPMAIVYYKRALRLNSAHLPSKKNLEFVLSMTRDAQSLPEDHLLDSFIEKAFYHFSINSLMVISLIIFATIIIIIHIQWRFVAMDRTVWRFINFILLFFLLGTVGITASRIYVAHIEEGVITENYVNVFSGPSENFTRLFTIHSGTVLKIQNQQAEWTQMTTLTGYSGWVKTQSFVRVKE